MKRFHKSFIILTTSLAITLIGCGASTEVGNDQATNPILQENIETMDANAEQSEFDYTSVSMSPTTSTVIAEEGYDPEYKILLLRFRSNAALYAYYNVSEEVYDEFVNSDSLGSYFGNNIKEIYKYERLESGEGYEIPTLYTETAPELATYVLNTGSGKFHKIDCTYANAENIAYVSDTKEELEDFGYVACKVCNP